MPQMMEPQKKRKKKGDKRLEFDASEVFDVKPNEEIELDMDAMRYTAQKGQGGDRRE